MRIPGTLAVTAAVIGVGGPRAAAIDIGCGTVGPDMVCSGHTDYNNSACACVKNIYLVYHCTPTGWHVNQNSPDSYTLGSPGNQISSDPKPCGRRLKCAVTAQGSDEEACTAPNPGCQFFGSHSDPNDLIIATTSLHPNYKAGAPC